MSDPHYCHCRPHCKVVVPRSMLMCKPHWSMVPYDLQRAVWSTFHKRHQNHDAMRAHTNNMRKAVDFVLAKIRVDE